MVRLPLLALLAAIVLVAACESHPDVTFADDDDTSTPSILFVTPEDGAEGVALEASIRVVFSEEMNPSTFDANAFQIAHDGTALEATIAVSGHIATLIPSVPLAFLRDYQVTVSTDVQDVGGQALTSALAISFTTRDLEWQTPRSVGAAYGYDAQNIGLSSVGDDVLASWEAATVGSTRDVLVAKYRPAVGWDSPVLVHSSALVSSIFQVRSSLAPSGDYLVVWNEFVGGESTLLARENLAGTFYPIETLAHFVGENGPRPRLQHDAQGNAILVWVQEPTVFARRFLTGTGWTPTQTLDIDGGLPEVAVELDGTATAIWSHNEAGIDQSIYYANFKPTTGWSAGQSVDGTLVEGGTGPIDLVRGANGKLLVVWSNSVASTFRVWMNDFSPGTGWGIIREVFASTDPLFEATGLLLSDGTPIVVFGRTSMGTRHILAASCNAASCATAQVLGLGARVTAVSDADGRAIVITTDNFGDNMASSRFHDGAWEPLEEIQQGLGGAYRFALVSRPNGEIVLAWLDEDYRPWVNELR